MRRNNKQNVANVYLYSTDKGHTSTSTSTVEPCSEVPILINERGHVIWTNKGYIVYTLYSIYNAHEEYLHEG